MSGDTYKIQDQFGYYFLTITVIHWIDIFTRVDYRDVIVDSLNYCIQFKKLEINAWVIMSNHVHLVGRVDAPVGMSAFLRDFKKFTSKRILDLIQEIPESRKDWLLDKFGFEARRTRRAENFKLWKDGNHAVSLQNIDALSKINYIHMNPVRAHLVASPEHYLYSSAIDYAGGKGLVKTEVI
ncbi:REP-associated tyrosine transposase [Roseivirga sp.]|uniref:REP-associated tyrosine transposase n=1 Tax=Roseivirga sp. TaxID=1964215 RepID=UPI003B524708